MVDGGELRGDSRNCAQSEPNAFADRLGFAIQKSEIRLLQTFLDLRRDAKI